MRLSNVERGDGIKHRVLFGIIRVTSGFRAPDVVRTLLYRKKFFGAPHTRHTRAAMRGPRRGRWANASCSQPTYRTSISACSELGLTPRSRRPPSAPS